MSLNEWLLLPPIAFVLMLFFMLLQLKGFGPLTFKGGKPSPGKGKPYACGEDVKDHRVQPDYEQFFSFAFFFTILHVVALVLATVPAGNLSAAVIGIGYGAAALVSVFILFKV